MASICTSAMSAALGVSSRIASPDVQSSPSGRAIGTGVFLPRASCRSPSHCVTAGQDKNCFKSETKSTVSSASGVINNAGGFSLSALLASFSAPAAAFADVDEIQSGLDGLANTLEGNTDFALDSTVASFQDNPVLLAGGAAAVIVPTILFFLLNRKGYAGDLSAEDAFSLLQNDASSILLDIRSKDDIAETGSPSLKSIRKKVISIPFEIEADGAVLDDPNFAERVGSKRGLSQDSVVLIIDKLGGLSPAAAKVLTKGGFVKVFAIKGGAEGTRGWKESRLLWDEPGPKFNLDFSTLAKALASTEVDSELATAGLGVAAAAGLSLVVFSEAEFLLQFLGSAALLQILAKKFLFAKDRKQTISEIQSFLDTKVAPKELLDEIKGIGAALLPEVKTSEAPVASTAEAIASTAEAPAASTAEAPAASTAEAPAASTAEAPAASTAEAPVASTAEAPVASTAVDESGNGASTKAPQTSTSPSTSGPPSPQPLSPSAEYSDLKPPTSPTPPSS
eukprot:jgi/Mesen1/1529/ME000133S00540